ERLRPDCPAVPEQHVEGDEAGRDLGREPADAALGGVQARLHGVEVERPAALDHDLAVERRAGRQQLAEGPQLGKVAQERPAVSRQEAQLAGDVLEQAAEAVPLRLELPARPVGQLAHEQRLHGRERYGRIELCRALHGLLAAGSCHGGTLAEAGGADAVLTISGSMRRVAVTGLGAVTPIGNDVRSTWEAALAGRSGVDTIRAFDASAFPVRIAAEVKG